MQAQEHIHDVEEDMGNLESECSLEAFELSLVDFEDEKQNKLVGDQRQGEWVEDYLGGWLDL